MSILELRNVEKIYGEKDNQVKALRNINLKVEEGEFVAIVGTSGSGKSTCLNLIGGLDNPTSGQIFIKNKEIGSLSRKELTIFRRRNIGFVFQNYSLMPVLNVYDNVALPVTFDCGKHINRKYIEELLRELGIWEKRKKYPNELSGGQQQRVAIARALANKPSILLCDEPTGNLDSATRAAFNLYQNEELGHYAVPNSVSRDAMEDEYELEIVSAPSAEDIMMAVENTKDTINTFVELVSRVIEKSPKIGYAVLLLHTGVKGAEFYDKMRLSSFPGNRVRQEAEEILKGGLANFDVESYKGYKSKFNDIYREEAYALLNVIIEMLG